MLTSTHQHLSVYWAIKTSGGLSHNTRMRQQLLSHEKNIPLFSKQLFSLCLSLTEKPEAFQHEVVFFLFFYTWSTSGWGTTRELLKDKHENAWLSESKKWSLLVILLRLSQNLLIISYLCTIEILYRNVKLPVNNNWIVMYFEGFHEALKQIECYMRRKLIE